VIGTARKEKHDFLAELGIDEAIDYVTGSPLDTQDPYDVIIDLIGGDTGIEAFSALHPGGLYIPVPSREAARSADRARECGFRVFTILVEPDGHALEQLAELVTLNQLQVEIDSVFPLEDVAEAHRRSETGRARGKIVLRVA
jgi:NADPH:quinone reductase-like Zn-dependent oxidoreductase